MSSSSTHSLRHNNSDTDIMIYHKDAARKQVLWWTCCFAVRLCCIVLLTNGVIYGLGLREQQDEGHRNSTTLSTFFPVLVLMITDAVIENPFAMGAAYTCTGVIYLVVAFGYRNLGAGITLLLQVALQLCTAGNDSKMVAILTGVMGAMGTLIAVVLLRQKIPTLLEYVLSLYNHDVVIVVVDKEKKDERVVEV